MKRGRVLVTGGAGFIGSHTVVELFSAGYEAVIVDDLSNSDPSVIRGIESIIGRKLLFHKIDCTDRQALESVFAETEFHSVIHFAARKAVAESVEQPLDYYRTNIISLLNVLDLMRLHGVNNIVFSSSATVYGQPDELPAIETTPRKAAVTPYGNTKQICEDIVRDSVYAYDTLKGISLRYFNPIGAHPSALIGELPQGVPNNLMPYITQTAAGIREVLSVFGDDYNTTDGSCLRDYIDVVDLARAHVAALGRMNSQKGERYEIFNIGTGRPVSVLELVRTFERVNGVKVPHQIAGRRTGDVEAVWADTSFAEKELNWKTERTLDQTLIAAWQWEQKRKGEN